MALRGAVFGVLLAAPFWLTLGWIAGWRTVGGVVAGGVLGGLLYAAAAGDLT